MKRTTSSLAIVLLLTSHCFAVSMPCNQSFYGLSTIEPMTKQTLYCDGNGHWTTTPINIAPPQRPIDAGTMRFNPATRNFEYFDGQTWVPVTAPNSN